MCVALAIHFQINHAVASNLIHHMLKERHSVANSPLAGAVEIEGDLNLSFQGVTVDAGNAPWFSFLGHIVPPVKSCGL